MNSRKVIALALLGLVVFSVGGCGVRVPVTGKYTFTGSSQKVTLTLNSNETYTLCPTPEPCGSGTYYLERQDGDTDQIYFYGAPMVNFAKGTETRKSSNVDENYVGTVVYEFGGVSIDLNYGLDDGTQFLQIAS